MTAERGSLFPAQRMRYQVIVMERSYAGAFGIRRKLLPDWRVGSTGELSVAAALLASIHLYPREKAVIEDVQTGEWVAIRRGERA